MGALVITTFVLWELCWDSPLLFGNIISTHIRGTRSVLGSHAWASNKVEQNQTAGPEQIGGNVTDIAGQNTFRETDAAEWNG